MQLRRRSLSLSLERDSNLPKREMYRRGCSSAQLVLSLSVRESSHVGSHLGEGAVLSSCLLSYHVALSLNMLSVGLLGLARKERGLHNLICEEVVPERRVDTSVLSSVLPDHAVGQEVHNRVRR